MIKETFSVKVQQETYEILKKIKEEQGIPFTEAIRIAIKEKFNNK